MLKHEVEVKNIDLKKISIHFLFYLNLSKLKCREYHSLTYNSTETCNFMKTTDNCQIDDGFINYLVFTYCAFDLVNTWIPIILMVTKSTFFEHT